jgi:hypothetical protein
VLAGLVSLGAHAAPLTDMQTLNGVCAAGSHTASGPLGTDLTKADVPYDCKGAVIGFFDSESHHVMIQFPGSTDGHDTVIGFGGYVQPDQRTIQVTHFYPRPGVKWNVTDSVCTLYFKPPYLDSIMCGAKYDHAGMRDVAVIVFQAFPGQ